MASKRKERWWIISALIILFIATLAMLFINRTVKDQEEIIEIDGIAVTHDELKREMERCRASIISQIVAEYNITDMAGFFEKKHNGQTPLEILRQTALDTLVFLKVQERLLKERDLWPYDHYSELISDLEKTNAVRSKAVKEKATIYGPINYTERSFFDYQFSNAVIQLKKKLVEEEELPIYEKDLLDYFNKLKGTIYQQEAQFEDVQHQVRDAFVEKMYATYIAELTGKANIISNKKPKK